MRFRFMGAPVRAIRQLLNITPAEVPRVVVLGLGWAFAIGFTIAGKAARDAIFLSRYDRSYLPLMVVAIAVAVAIAIAGCSKLARVAAPRQLLVAACGVFAVSMFVFRIRLEGWTVPLLYVWVELGTVILGLEFWLMASDLVDSRQAKRLFGLIAGGGSLAAIVVGSQLKPFVKAYGASSLLLLVAGFAVAAGVMGVVAWRFPPVPQPAAKRRLEITKSRKFDGYLTSIAIVVCAAAVASTLVDYQFKIIAGKEIASEADLVGFFGMFSAATGFSSLLFQFVLTGRVLSSLGIVGGLALLPLAVGTASAYLLISPVLVAAALAKFSDQTFKFTVHNSGLECLWLPIPYARRQEVKPWITGTLKSTAEGLCGLATFFLVKLVPLSLLSLIVLGACAFWIWVLIRLRNFYSRALEDALRSRAVEYDELTLDVQDPGVVAIVNRSLTASDENDRLFALELIADLPLGPWAGTLQQLMETGTPAVRRRILQIAAGDARAIPDSIVVNAIGGDPSVTEVAIRTALTRGIPNLTSSVRAVLAASHPGVRAAATRALYQVGVEPESQKQVVREMLRGTEQEQVAALTELTELPALMPDHVLDTFLRSPLPTVRQAAVEVAAARGSIELIPRLLDCLADRATARAARTALLRFPHERVLEEIARRFGQPLTDEERIVHVRMLAHLPPPEKACSLLCSQLTVEHPPVQVQVADSLLAVCRLSHPRREVLKQVETAGLPWVHSAYLASESSRLLPPGESSALLRDHFEHAYFRSISGLLKLLSLRRPSVPVETCLYIIRANDKTRMSFVLDLLDSFLSLPERRSVVPLFDMSAGYRGEIGRRFFPDLPVTLEQVLDASIRSARDWEQAIALDFAFRQEHGGIQRAAWASSCAGPLAVEVLAKVMRTMPDVDLGPVPPAVTMLAARNSPMFSTLEKTIILKSASLFSCIATETLSRVAQMADEVSFSADSVVYRDGDPGTAMYVVASGAVQARTGNIDLGILRRGEPFGEIAALNRDMYRADVTAVEDTVLLRITQEDLFELMQSNIEIMQGIIALLSRRVIQIGGFLRDTARAASN